MKTFDNWIEVRDAALISTAPMFYRMTAITSFNILQENIDDGEGHIFAKVNLYEGPSEDGWWQNKYIFQSDVARLLTS
jgi:hypothetical protein